MSTKQQPPGAGDQPMAAALPNPRCECDHLLSQHRTEGDIHPCREMVIDGESSFRHTCRCADFNQPDHLGDAIAILNGTTLKMPQLRHLAALNEALTKFKEDVQAARTQAAEEVFLLRVAVQLYGKFSVLCERCDHARDFPAFAGDEAAEVLSNEGWELEKGAESWKLVCPKCFLT